MYLNEFCIDKSDYNEYIRRYAPKKLDAIIDGLDDEDMIEGYTLGLSNSRNCFYDQLWLIDSPNGYIPVLIENINTSSGMAVWTCGIYRDVKGEISLDDIIEMVGEGWRKGLRKVLVENYIKDKVKEEEECIYCEECNTKINILQDKYDYDDDTGFYLCENCYYDEDDEE